MANPVDTHILTLSCLDRPGIVAAVSGRLAELGGFILDSQQYADLESGRFFMRVVFNGAGGVSLAQTAALASALEPVVAQFAMDWQLRLLSARPRAVIAVSKASHCLNDLLHRWSTETLAMDIAAVVSNHDSLRDLVQWHGLPFHYLPVSDANRAEQEAQIGAIMDETQSQYLVLARYMQILSPEMAAPLSGRCINIHHSFLPGFKGAKPYHRAHARGVKLIGATAHFVTGDLDEGPIIEQAVERVDHRDTVDDLIRIGRDIEAQVLARGVQMVAQQRVLIDGLKTVVFR